MMQFCRRVGVVAGAWVLAAQAVSAAPLTEGQARRFLAQATFGPTQASVNELMRVGPGAWLNQQFAAPVSQYSGRSHVDPDRNLVCPAGSAPTCQRDRYGLFPVQVQFFNHAMNGPDQLRQRTALALSQILVVSGQQVKQGYAMANYQQMLLDHAFGNYKDLLTAVTLSPAMGRFLNMANNSKADPAKGIEPNENYAREVLQLFSIGLWQLHADGTPVLAADGVPRPSFDQETVEGFAHVFTGWTYAPRPGATRNRFGNPTQYASPMIAFADFHDTGAKKLLNGVVLPAGQSPRADLAAAIDNIFAHPNVGPFIGRQLIQQFVTSNPSPAYVARVTAAFNGGAKAPRGDMKAVLTAVLTDPEASAPPAPERFGKLREPILQLTHLFRALGGRSDGVWLRSAASGLGQPVFSPPSVFNFFPPDYDLPNDPTLDGPAFGVFNASRAFRLSGTLATALNGRGVAADASVAGATGSWIDMAPWRALSANAPALVREINRVLFAGRMSAGLQQTLLQAVALYPVSKATERAYGALFLAVMSPEYLVEH